MPNGSSAVIVSSGGSDDSDPVEVDFCGEPALLKYLELRSGRPEMLDVVDEICDCDCVTRALEDRLGSVAAILCKKCRSGRAPSDLVWRNAVAERGEFGRPASVPTRPETADGRDGGYEEYAGGSSTEVSNSPRLVSRCRLPL